MDLFYTILTFLGGLIGGLVLAIYRYKDYIYFGLSELMNAYRDGKLDIDDGVRLLIDAYAYFTHRDVKTVALEIIQYIKKNYGLE